MQSREKNYMCVNSRALLAVLLGVATCSFGQMQQQQDELTVGLRYVQGLQDMLFLDIADSVLKDLTVKFPEASVKFAALELQGDLTRGNFDEVKARIAAAEKRGEKSDVVWGMKLALADSYFTYAKHDECRSIYETFFNTFKKKDNKGKDVFNVPEALQSTYTDAAYKYAQMLLNMKQREAALNMYRLLVGMKTLPDYIKRQCMAECSEIALTIADETNDAAKRKALCAEVDKLCNDLLWVRDLWFGKAIVLKAHVYMLQDDPDKAKALIDTYNSTLTAIHQALVEQEKETGDPLTRVSPMAECRYLLAVMLQERAESIMSAEGFNINDAEQRESVLSLLLGVKKNGKRKGDGAYNHFVNVYLKYPESNWAADAGEHSEQVREILVNKFGGNVKSNVTPEQEAKVREIQFRDAHTAYMQGHLDVAKDRSIQVLNRYPDAPEAIVALGDLARCYMADIVKSSDEAIIYTDAIIGHLAERFSGERTMITAGDMLIGLAERWGEYERDDLRLSVYGKFFDNYPNHPACVTYLTSFAEKAYQEENYTQALDYFTKVANNYKSSPRAIDALSRIASIHEKDNDFGKLVPVLAEMEKRLGGDKRPVQALYTTRFRRANALRNAAFEAIEGENATNEVEVAKAKKILNAAVKAYDELITDLVNPPTSAQVDDREKEQNALVREASIFGKAAIYSRYPETDEAKKNEKRAEAIKAFEIAVKDYPKGESAPKALIQIGSLYTIMKEVEKAEAALSQLRKDYPDSDEAKSALPLMADNLMKLGMREEATARYREMFASSSADYSDYDILRAVNALMDSKEYDLAAIGIDKIVSKEDSPIASQARFAECKLVMAQKNYPLAVDKLVAFTNSFPRISLALEATELMSESASMAGLSEKDSAKRQEFFDTAILAMKDLQKRRTNDVEVAECDIAVGRIMINKAVAEEEFGDKNKASDYRGKALISFINFLESGNSRKPQLQPLVEKTYYEVIPLLMEHKQLDMALENADAYIQRFPSGKYISQVNAWRNQISAELDSQSL